MNLILVIKKIFLNVIFFKKRQKYVKMKAFALKKNF